MSNATGRKIVSGMFWRFGEKITAQAVSFIVSVILARILMPEDYGIVGIVTIFYAIAEVFVTSGLGTALIQKKDATQEDFSTVFWCNLALSAVIYLIVFLTAPWIAAIYKMPDLTLVLRVFALRLPVNAVNSIQNAWVSRRMDFKKFFFATIIGTIISAVVGIVMAYKGFGVWALVAQIMTNSVIDTLVLFLTIKWRPSKVLNLEAAKPLIGYGWKILATDLVGTIFNHLHALVIGTKYTTDDLAYYTQGRRYPDLINSNVCATLASVLFPAMSMSNGLEEIRQIRRKSLKMMEYISFPILLGMFTVADTMIIALVTEKWIASVPYLRIACITAVMGILGATLIQELKAIGRSDLTLKLELVKKPLYLVIVLIAMQFGVDAIAYSLILIEVIAFCLNVYPVRKYIGFDFKLLFKDALGPFLMSIVMCAAVWGIGKLITPAWLCLAVQILAGAAIYLALSVITRNDSFIYLKDMLKSKLPRR